MSAKSCNPLNSVYCNLKVKIAGNLNEKDLDSLYDCTLCNDCHTADFNRGAREIAVSRNFIAPHVGIIRKNISETGNPYGDSSKRHGSGTCETILFRGCTPAYKTPEMLAAVESLLQRKSISYGLIEDETCCGNILFNLGDRASGMDAVSRNIKKFRAAGVERIVTICPGCYSAFSKYYKGVDGFNPEIVLAVDLLDGMEARGEGYVIQDPCHAKEKGSIVRKLLPGASNKSASPCCGAGSGLLTHDKLLAGEKAKKAFDGENSTIVTYCPFCYLNLRAVRPEKVLDAYQLINNTSHNQ